MEQKRETQNRPTDIYMEFLYVTEECFRLLRERIENSINEYGTIGFLYRKK